MRPIPGEWIAGALLLAAFAWGGAPGSSHVAVQAVGAGALAWALLARASPAVPRPDIARGLDRILLAGVLLALLQLVPLPPELWRALPHRASVHADLIAAGIAPGWRPMSLDVPGTLRALLGFQVFAGMWMLASALDPAARGRLLRLALAAAMVMSFIGAVQVRGKADTTGAMATFDNRNHFAALLAMLVPFAVGLAVTSRARGARAIGAGVVAVLLVLAAALTFSRAGSVLALGSAVVAALALRRYAPSTRRPWAVAAMAGAVVLPIVAYLASGRLGERFATDVAGDARWRFAAISLDAAAAYLPWGSGLGSFRWVYQGFEPAERVGQWDFATHAHNELLEIAVEAGVPGLILAAAFLAWVVVAIARVRGDRGPWPRAAAVSCAVVLVHSLVDFPLRTDACSVMLALALSVLCGREPSRRDA